jgi:GntR family transcriptional regulator
MDFQASNSIYLQIAQLVCEDIMNGKLSPGERAPSIRELAEEIEVNRNTVFRTYSYLQDKEILVNSRGVGFFIANDAIAKIQERKKEEFFTAELPQLITKVKQLKLNSSDMHELLMELKLNDNLELK